MESQPQNPEFRIHPENFHPCYHNSLDIGKQCTRFSHKILQNCNLPGHIHIWALTLENLSSGGCDQQRISTV